MKLEIYGGSAKIGFSAVGEYERGIDPLLKPCPFCGNENILVLNTHTPAYWAECEKCETSKSASYSFGDRLISKKQTKEEHRKSFLSAIEGWNKRM